jgi:HD-GYP domain-containing protein (c-di-GMP phosphodiesterase class II)
MHTKFLVNLKILIVENDAMQRDLLVEFCNIHGGTSYPSKNVTQSLELIESNQFDVALCDIFLNGDGSGFDLFDHIQKIDSDLTTVFITGQFKEEVASEIIKKEVYAILTKPFDITTLGLILLQAARNTRNNRRNKYVSNNLKAKIDIIQKDKNRIFINTLSALSAALEQKDEYTKDHSEKVGDLAGKICWEYTYNRGFIEDVINAGKLHDIGKIGIRDDILFKKGSLTEGEYAIIKMHPENSYRIVKPVDVAGKISEYVLHHHERWDGEGGYPHNLKEKGIPVGSRILAVADTFDALTSSRPYRIAKDRDFALNVIMEGSGKQFDPEIVEIMFKLIRTGKIDSTDWKSQLS